MTPSTTKTTKTKSEEKSENMSDDDQKSGRISEGKQSSNNSDVDMKSSEIGSDRKSEESSHGGVSLKVLGSKRKPSENSNSEGEPQTKRVKKTEKSEKPSSNANSNGFPSLKNQTFIPKSESTRTTDIPRGEQSKPLNGKSLNGTLPTAVRATSQSVSLSKLRSTTSVGQVPKRLAPRRDNLPLRPAVHTCPYCLQPIVGLLNLRDHMDDCAEVYTHDEHAKSRSALKRPLINADNSSVASMNDDSSVVSSFSFFSLLLVFFVLQYVCMFEHTTVCFLWRL